MSTAGTAVKLDHSGQSVSFTVPEDIGEINVYNLKYRAEADTSILLTVGDSPAQTVVLPATRPHYYESFGEKEIPIQSGETITVALAENNELYLDSISFRYA